MLAGSICGFLLDGGMHFPSLVRRDGRENLENGFQPALEWTLHFLYRDFELAGDFGLAQTATTVADLIIVPYVF